MKRWAPLISTAWITLAISCGCTQTASKPVADRQSPAVTQVSVASNARDPTSKMQSCATAACHGDMFDIASAASAPGAEFVFFQSRDPHSQASATLDSDVSKRMLAALAKATSKSRLEWMNSCRGCHAPTANGREPQRNGLVADFGCAACHTSASDTKWIDSHFQSEHDPSAYPDTTANLYARAQLCSKCHVGTPGFQVDHDMIAAGHPALKFELASYSELLPKHWSDEFERASITDLELRLWLGGQVATAKRSLDLLDARLSKANTIWPEFSELDCFQCHQDLRGSGWQGNDAASMWGTWYFWPAGLNDNAQSDEGHPQREYAVSALSLQRAMGSTWRQPQSRADRVTERQRDELRERLVALERDLKTWLSAQAPRRRWQTKNTPSQVAPFDQPVPPEVSLIVQALLTAAPARDWDGAVQRYLALAAIIQSMQDRKSFNAILQSELQSGLNSLRKQLRFEEGLNSPVWSNADTGGEAARTKFNEAFSRLCKRVLDHQP